MSKVIEVAADDLEKARHQAKAQVPPGYVIDAENVISSGVETVRTQGATADEAFARAAGHIPFGFRITDKRQVIAPSTRKACVDAFTELEARSLFDKSLDRYETVGTITRITKPRAGFLGWGRKAGTYEVVVTRQAAVEVTYRTQARISVTLLTEEERLERLFDFTVAEGPSPQHKPVRGEDDLHVGDVIRIWHEMMENWIPGWWMEVVQIEGRKVQLRDLMSGEMKSRHIGDTVSNAYKHPEPKAARLIGQQGKAREIEQSQREAIRSRAPRAIDFEAARIGREIARRGR
jgi:hypothetical protein